MLALLLTGSPAVRRLCRMGGVAGSTAPPEGESDYSPRSYRESNR